MLFRSSKHNMQQLHNDDLDHVRQLTRSKHGGTKKREQHLATLWTHSPRRNYSRITGQENVTTPDPEVYIGVMRY